LIRTRFAPSPTGYLHLGGARTALFNWAYAKRHGGAFVLRVEDTDLERSTQQSVQAIFDAMEWLGLDYSEGPFFQMQRLSRYREVAELLLAKGHAYWDNCSKEELDAMREAQVARGEKPRYDRRWRDSKETPPPGRAPALRFKNPLAGQVTWDDHVKGPITVANDELDDLVLLRADGVPTYNFGVVVDDIDMAITHVIRGDDHVNNTPRQIHIFAALGKPLPAFAHVPMILGADGERLSKRHGAVSVMQYMEEGFLPEALDNYLARLGWSHGNEEVFTRKQLVEWFDLGHVSRSPAQFDPAKALWMNQQYLKHADDVRLSGLTELVLKDMGIDARAGPPIDKVVALLKDRANTVVHLAENARMFYTYEQPMQKDIETQIDNKMRPALQMLKAKLAEARWERKSIAAAIAEVLKANSMKMPELAMPVRLLVTGRTQTPSLDAVLELLGRDTVLQRLVV
jgi:glutamyl-tRNA synthetase